MAEAKAKQKKRLFVVSQIGEPESEERRQADWLLEAIVRPVGNDLDYVVTRADEIATPGLITDQVIAAVLDSEVVVADLTGLNPNVFYELGIRHMKEKPTIHMYIQGQALPFDIKDYRTIMYRIAHPRDVEIAKAALRAQLEEISKDGHKISNPITRARGHQLLSEGRDEKDILLANLISQVGDLSSQVKLIKERSFPVKISRASGVNKPYEVENVHVMQNIDNKFLEESTRSLVRQILFEANNRRNK